MDRIPTVVGPGRRSRRWLGAACSLGLAGATWIAVGASAATGAIGPFAGTGSQGAQGDGGMAADARLNGPRTVAVDREGNVYIADTDNNKIRKVDTAGRITTVAGTGSAGSDGDGGPATLARIKWPHSVAVDGQANIYIADSPNHKIRRVDHQTGIITTVAGTGRAGTGGDGGPAVAARLDNPKGVAVGPDGALYIADSGNHRVRRVGADGVIATVAGNGEAGGAGDGGPAVEAQVLHPRVIAFDGLGALYISEDTEGEISRIRKVDPTGRITRWAGTGAAGYSGDGGPATEAMLNRPRGIAADAAGNLYIADSENYRVRKVSPGGTITTIGGTGRQGDAGDGGPATEARLSIARGLAVGPEGDLLLADTGNHRIRRISGVAAPWGPPPSGPGPTATGPASSTTTTTTGPLPPPLPGRSGYWMVSADGAVHAFGDAVHHGDATPALPRGVDAVDLEPTPSGEGYWVVDAAGGVHPLGDARSFGRLARLLPGERVTSLSATPSGSGYWLFTDRGRAGAFGDAGFFGDMSGQALNGPVLDSVPTPSGGGYWLVASDGGIFAFGDARFHGSMGGAPLNAPVQSLVPDGDGTGYWLVASDGGVFAFDAPFRGSMGGRPLNRPISGMVAFGDGYLMVAEDGGVFNFSDRAFAGSLGSDPPARPVVAVAPLTG